VSAGCPLGSPPGVSSMMSSKVSSGGVLQGGNPPHFIYLSKTSFT
jgi:hypothetical protein